MELNGEQVTAHATHDTPKVTTSALGVFRYPAAPSGAQDTRMTQSTDRPRDESVFLFHAPCDACGSRDNKAVYASGRTYCHGCKATEFPEDADALPQHRQPRNRMYNEIHGEFMPIASAYGINDITCRKLGLKIVQYSPPPRVEGADRLPKKGCISFPYHDPKTGDLWGQKIRYKISDEEKTFGFPHAPGKPPLWLQHLWGPGADTRSIVVFEGEGDCAAYYQMNDGKYPCVSLPTGASGCIDALKQAYDFLTRFTKIVLIFDGDAAGREWVRKAAEVLPAGKVFTGEVQGFKDARSALMAGEGSKIINAYFNADMFKPDGIFKARDLVEKAKVPVTVGIPWWSDTLTQWTYGRRPGECYFLGAGNAVGKTDFCTQAIAYDVQVLKLPTGVIYLEQDPVETMKRLAGKVAGRPFHLPIDCGEYTQEELEVTLDALGAHENLVFGGNFSASAWDDIRERIRFLAVALGIKSIWLDNLTALIDPKNERASVETIVKEMALLAQELKVIIHLVCHLATPEGRSHEEGGRVSLKHFKGSRAIGAFAHYAFGLERNTVADDPEERLFTTVRCVKDRYTGRASGNTMTLRYDRDTCQLVESLPYDGDGASDDDGIDLNL
jgi:twinkle protein